MDIKDFFEGDKANETDDGIDHVKEAIEKGSEYEGDMMLNEEEKEAHKADTNETSNAATTLEQRKWPKKGNETRVPYVISSSFSTGERRKIAKAIQDYESKTCVR